MAEKINTSDLTCFKSCDIRGKLGEEIDENIAYDIGRATAQFLSANKIVIGADSRLSSPSLKKAVAEGVTDAGCAVLDIGLCGTEEIYFATSHLNADGGMMITASHNPVEYNGIKLVRKNSKPISQDSGLRDIKKIVEQRIFNSAKKQGSLTAIAMVSDYVKCLLEHIDVTSLTPITIVTNAGNGAAGHVIDEIERVFNNQSIPVTFIKVHHEPNGHFPNGVPNPLLADHRQDTVDAVLLHQASFGVAWDGDFDRCFFIDEQGRFIESYYIVGLLAEFFLQKYHGEKVVYDPRLTFNTTDIIHHCHGIAIQSKAGHANFKERMRRENAIYGGEMSGHHYFRDFNFCDSGMIPWLLIMEQVCRKKLPLSALVSDRIALYPSSGEINCQVRSTNEVIKQLNSVYGQQALKKEMIDGLTLEFESWRFNIRQSNTESLMRLNVESKGDELLLQEKTRELLHLIDEISG